MCLGAEVEAFEAVDSEQKVEMGCFYDIPIEFDEATPWENVPQRMEDPFKEIQRRLIKEERI